MKMFTLALFLITSQLSIASGVCLRVMNSCLQLADGNCEYVAEFCDETAIKTAKNISKCKSSISSGLTQNDVCDSLCYLSASSRWYGTYKNAYCSGTRANSETSKEYIGTESKCDLHSFKYMQISFNDSKHTNLIQVDDGKHRLEANKIIQRYKEEEKALKQNYSKSINYTQKVRDEGKKNFSYYINDSLNKALDSSSSTGNYGKWLRLCVSDRQIREIKKAFVKRAVIKFGLPPETSTRDWMCQNLSDFICDYNNPWADHNRSNIEPDVRKAWREMSDFDKRDVERFLLRQSKLAQANDTSRNLGPRVDNSGRQILKETEGTGQNQKVETNSGRVSREP